MMQMLYNKYRNKEGEIERILTDNGYAVRDGADEDVEYEYDSNGNMTVDLNRGIKEIEYDLNNRPVSVTFSTRPAEQRTKYLYDASGRKLRTTYQTSRFLSLGPGDLVHVDTLKLGPGIGGIGGIGGLKPLSSPAAGIGGSFFDPGLAKDPGGILDMWQTSYVRDYCGDIIYKDGEVERILTDNVDAVPDSAGGYDYYYYVKDWQGNVRAVIDEANRRMELNNYYPYGMPMSSTASVQPYKYGGKELDRANGLDMYDFHARHYDPIVPHFITMDELCEKYPSISPYAYCAGNPIRYVDPTGMVVQMFGSATEEERNRVLADLQQLSNHKLSFVQQDNGNWHLTEDLNTKVGENNFSNGTALISDAINNEHTASIVIEHTGGFAEKDADNVAATNGEGSNVYIYYSVQQSPKIGVSRGGGISYEERPSYIGLAHEMIHGVRSMNGIIYDKTGGKITQPTFREELETIGIGGNSRYIINENLIRLEHGLDKRIMHYGK